MKKTALATILIAIISLSSATWIVYNQFSNMQAQISDLHAQNSELESQISDLQNQIVELQEQNGKLEDRVKQLLEQQSEDYNSPVQITAYKWIDGFNVYGALTLYCPVNVTIQNNGDVEVRGLSLTVKLINIYDGSQIGQSGGTDLTQIGKSGPHIEPLSPGETREIRTWTYYSLSESLADAAVVITLTFGDTVIDQWIRSIN